MLFVTRYRCASTLGSLLSASLQAELSFFNTDVIAPPVQPRTAVEALRVVETVKAVGGTSMACALWPYYSKRKKLDIIVLVSDEGENAKHNGFYFAELFQKYRNEVSPNVKLVLVSFLAVGETGTIKERINAVGLDATQLRLVTATFCSPLLLHRTLAYPSGMLCRTRAAPTRPNLNHCSVWCRCKLVTSAKSNALSTTCWASRPVWRNRFSS